MPPHRIRKAPLGEVLREKGEFTLTKNKGLGVRFCIWKKIKSGYNMIHSHKTLGNPEFYGSLEAIWTRLTEEA